MTDPPAPPKPSPKRRTKEETQERIVLAAIELLARRGYERASISAIARRAEVSRSAIFWHFGDKEGLFRETFRRMLLPFYEELQSGLTHVPPRERVFAILDAYERVVDEHELAIRSIMRWLLESEKLRASLLETLFALHDAFVADLAGALQGLGIAREESADLAAGLASLLDGNLLLGILDPRPRSGRQRSRGVRELAARVIGERRGE